VEISRDELRVPCGQVGDSLGEVCCIKKVILFHSEGVKYLKVLE
jgi:hypothetical protein